MRRVTKQVRYRKAVANRLQELLQTDEGMARFLDDLFGVGSYIFDPESDVWVVPDKDHCAPGRGFIIVERGGNWFKSVLPDAVLS